MSMYFSTRDNNSKNKAEGTVVLDEESTTGVDLDEEGKGEYGGPKRNGRYKEPTRFGDWEQKGRCSDF